MLTFCTGESEMMGHPPNHLITFGAGRIEVAFICPTLPFAD
jgi:hypothetical protein